MKDFGFRIARSKIEGANEARRSRLEADYEALRGQLSRRGLLGALGTDLDAITEKVADFTVALPSWGLGTGGTRFGRYPGASEPEDVFDKLVDSATVNQLTGATPRVSLHIPWDRAGDPSELAAFARELGLSFDAVNSNTFQDQPDQALSYKFGSLCHTDAAVRRQAIDHNLEVIEYGRKIGSRAITIWLADGSNFPGQMHLRRSLERVISSLSEIYSQLPDDWILFTEHKPYEPAFYATVVQDWGTSLMICRELGERARCLVDLGHHLPNTNIEQVVARLVRAGRLGGFHLNDSKFGDDDLTAGSIKPYQLFLVFNELVDAALDPSVPKGPCAFDPVYMVDQSHNLKDPIEALVGTVEETRKAYARALLVDRRALDELQESNDVFRAEEALRAAFDIDVRPVLAMARLRRGAPIDPVALFRESGYREEKKSERKAALDLGGGIV